MSDRTALVLWASEHGHTEKIAARIAEVLRREGVDARVQRAGHGADPSPADHDGVVIAASVHRGAHQHEVVEYARRHRTLLSARPSAFVSVSLTAADDATESRDATQQLIDEFLDETGWIPETTISVAGALQYREYDFVTRLVMRLIASRYEADTDTAHDHEYTDWDAVERFAASFGARLRRAAPAVADP